jgi:hypothetical protein
MAEALDIADTSWSGPAASYMITRAVVGADTIQKGCIYVEDGIRKAKKSGYTGIERHRIG